MITISRLICDGIADCLYEQKFCDGAYDEHSFEVSRKGNENTMRFQSEFIGRYETKNIHISVHIPIANNAR